MRSLVALIAALSAVSPVVRAQTADAFEFEVETLGGQTLTHELFANNVLLVDYWGTWCGPCKQAVPVLQKLYAKYKQYGLEILGLAYETDAGPRVDENVRRFAASHGVTYHLAIGTPKEKRLVPGLTAYPTMLLFKRGLEFDRKLVGFAPETEGELEGRIRSALGLEPLAGDKVDEGGAGTGQAERSGQRGEDVADDLGDAKPPLDLPAGVIFKPGDGDTGFEFEVEDADGNKIVFAELRGKPVVLAFTSTWDGEATRTAAVLDKLQTAVGKEVHVLAASLELQRDRAAKVAAIRAFRDEHGLSYRIFPAGLGFQKKVHLFSGMPMFLVFDAEGVLVLRETGAGEPTSKLVEDKLRELRG